MPTWGAWRTSLGTVGKGWWPTGGGRTFIWDVDFIQHIDFGADHRMNWLQTVFDCQKVVGRKICIRMNVPRCMCSQSRCQRHATRPSETERHGSCSRLLQSPLCFFWFDANWQRQRQTLVRMIEWCQQNALPGSMVWFLEYFDMLSDYQALMEGCDYSFSGLKTAVRHHAGHVWSCCSCICCTCWIAERIRETFFMWHFFPSSTCGWKGRWWTRSCQAPKHLLLPRRSSIKLELI